MRIILNTFLVSSCLLILTSCSVMMAAKKSGTDINTISGCHTRTCLLDDGGKPIKEMASAEIIQFQKPTGSAGRAAMHGVLDVATLGIWEVAGTPIEASQGRKEMFAVKAIYEKDRETIKSIQLMG